MIVCFKVVEVMEKVRFEGKCGGPASSKDSATSYSASAMAAMAQCPHPIWPAASSEL